MSTPITIMGYKYRISKNEIETHKKSSVPKLDSGKSLIKSCGLQASDKRRTICFNDDPYHAIC